MNKVYGFGIGGKHRNTTDARRFRALTAEIAKNIAATYPRMGAALAMTHANDEARRVVSALNRIEINATLPA